MDLFNASLFVGGIAVLSQVSMPVDRNLNNPAKTRQWMICPSPIVLVLHGCALYVKWAVKWLTGYLKFNDTIDNGRIKADIVTHEKGNLPLKANGLLDLTNPKKGEYYHYNVTYRVSWT
jgi:hypothetical protein